MEMHYFLTTNGSQHKTSYLAQTLSRYRDVIVLSGYPRSVAAALIREYYAIAKQNRMEIHLIHNCLDNSTEGMLLPDLKTGLVNLPIYEENRFDVNAVMQNDFDARYVEYMQGAYAEFEAAKTVHDDWEKVYIEATDYQALDCLAAETIKELIPHTEAAKVGTAEDRFFGAATINGSVDYIDSLSSGCKRYFIKGRPGTGKSTFLKKVAQAAIENGYTAERYHCAFDPQSLDMVIVRELGLCLFDSTAPHEYFPSRDDDKILDIYAAAVKTDTDETNQKLLTELSSRYKTHIAAAVKQMIAANEVCLQYEEKLKKQLSQDKLMNVRKRMMERIFP